MAGQSIVLKKYVHIGVAVDTDRGPAGPGHPRRGQEDASSELSVELAAIAEKTKAGKLQPSEMQGGSFTISNLGGIGGTYFTPDRELAGSGHPGHLALVDRAGVDGRRRSSRG